MSKTINDEAQRDAVAALTGRAPKSRIATKPVSKPAPIVVRPMPIGPFVTTPGSPKPPGYPGTAEEWRHACEANAEDRARRQPRARWHVSAPWAGGFDALDGMTRGRAR